jgi:hypothetical protein
MSKKLNTNSITNELEHSSFFPAKPQVSSRPASGETEPGASLQTQVQRKLLSPTVTRPKAVAENPSTQLSKTAPGTDRSYVRRTFDIFEDQLAYLTRASLEDRIGGGDGSMNAMVRQALDDFIGRQKRR